MTDNDYQDYIPNLIDSMLLNLEVSESNFLLIKHYNSFDLTEEYVSVLAEERKNQKFMYHSFDSSDMLSAFEPFINWIKQLYYELSDESLEDFFDESEVYQLHRFIFRSYFETGVCKRKEEVLVSEIEFEQKMFIKEIVRMMYVLSLKKPLVLVLNKLHAAGTSTIEVVSELIANKYSKNMAILATYNEVAPEIGYVSDSFQALFKKLDEHDCIIDWTLNTMPLSTDSGMVFKFSNSCLSDYFIKLNNMMNMLSLDQATYYLEILYHKFEIEKLSVISKFKFIFLEMYTKIAMYQDKTSDALLYSNGMRILVEEEDNPNWRFKYNYIAAEIQMNSFHKEMALVYAQEARRIAISLDNHYLIFKSELLEFMIDYNGWRNIWLLEEDHIVGRELLENCKKYEYNNHLAHLYVYSYDNDDDLYKDVTNIESVLVYFNKGINIAKRIGNDQFLIEAYKKNVMAASTIGYYDVANYFYTKCYDIVKKNNDLMEEGNIYNGMGYNCCTIEKYAKANEYFNKALMIFVKLNDINHISETLYNMAVNAILAEEYAVADNYLGMCLKMIKITRTFCVRVCNVSKLYGLKALCCFKMKILYNCKINLQSIEQYLGNIIERDANDYIAENHIWDDDLFLLHYVNALLLENEGEYDEALSRLDRAKKPLEKSRGSQFFNYVPYATTYARICRKIGRDKEAEEILECCLKFCDEKAYIHKKNLVKSQLDGTPYHSMKWNLSLKGVTLEDITDMTVHYGIEKDYREQKNEIEFLGIWQKIINNDQQSLHRILENSVRTLKNYYNLDEILFIRIENGLPVIKYNDVNCVLSAEKLNYLVRYFKKNRSEFVTSRLDKSFVEHSELMDTIFECNEIHTLICAPVFINEKLSSLFIGFIYMTDNSNYRNKRYSFDESDISILMLLFRQLLDAIERFEAREKIQSINKELKFVNDRLKQLAICDNLTGLFNRQGFSEEITNRIRYCEKAKKDVEISFLYADLDNFKYYNDTFGHDIGDLILKEFSTIISNITKDRGYAVRYGGDEFILVIYSVDRQEVEQAAKDIYASLEREKGFEDKISAQIGKKVKIPKERNVSCSVGISNTSTSADGHTKDKIDETLKHADEMMYYVKKTTKHRYVFYDDIKDDVDSFMKNEKNNKKNQPLSDR